MADLERFEKIPRFRKILDALYERKIISSSQFFLDIQQFSQPKEKTIEIFIEGIKIFIAIANKHHTFREAYYGNKIRGLYYPNNLASLLMEEPNCEKDLSSEKLKFVCPRSWDYEFQDPFIMLIYRGEDLACALDELLYGPTAIDCGMFCQLSIWFGLRYMLGNADFNELFGKAPFYVTQSLYNECLEDPPQAWIGNHLYWLFDAEGGDTGQKEVLIEHVRNHFLYPYKHPAGNASGDNCIVFNNKGERTYWPFSPMKMIDTNTKEKIEEMLLTAFNDEQSAEDLANIIIYSAQDPALTSPLLGQKTFRELASQAKSLEKYIAGKIDTRDLPHLSLKFNFTRLLEYLRQAFHCKETFMQMVGYQFLPDEAFSQFSMVGNIPHENQCISFSTFKQDTPAQQDIYRLGMNFCASVVNGVKSFLLINGTVGIGKTALSVCCAKELSKRQKKIAWYSEVELQKVPQKKFPTYEELMTKLSDQENDATFSSYFDGFDVIIFDDINHSTLVGSAFFKELYEYYIRDPFVSVFITSNEKSHFSKIYGIRLDGYSFPPPPAYNKKHYLNMCFRTFTAESMRLKDMWLIGLPMADKRELLLADRAYKRSLAVVLSFDEYHEFLSSMSSEGIDPEKVIEYIPSCDQIINKLNMAIRARCDNRDDLLPEYINLEQRFRSWIKCVWIEKMRVFNFDSERCFQSYTSSREKWFQRRPFYTTEKTTIVIEFKNDLYCTESDIGFSGIRWIEEVVHHVFNRGGKKVILVNNTAFSEQELIDKIKTSSHISSGEEQRFPERLGVLFSKIDPLEQPQAPIVDVVDDGCRGEVRSSSCALSVDVYTIKKMFPGYSSTSSSFININFSLTKIQKTYKKLFASLHSGSSSINIPLRKAITSTAASGEKVSLLISSNKSSSLNVWSVFCTTENMRLSDDCCFMPSVMEKISLLQTTITVGNAVMGVLSGEEYQQFLWLIRKKHFESNNQLDIWSNGCNQAARIEFVIIETPRVTCLSLDCFRRLEEIVRNLYYLHNKNIIVINNTSLSEQVLMRQINPIDFVVDEGKGSQYSKDRHLCRIRI